MCCVDGYWKSLKYGLYARKSSESEERQVLSIDSQISDETDSHERKPVIDKVYEENTRAKLPDQDLSL